MPHNSRLNERCGDSGTKTIADYSCVVAKPIPIYLGTIVHPQLKLMTMMMVMIDGNDSNVKCGDEDDNGDVVR